MADRKSKGKHASGRVPDPPRTASTRAKRREQERAIKHAERVAAKRIADKRRRRRLLLHRAVRSRVFLASLCLFAMGAAAVGSVLVLARSGPTRVSGTLRQVGGIHFTPQSQSDGGVSPVCGCVFPPVGSWRGVTFAARAISLTRSGSSRWTEWMGSGALPDTISFSSLLKRLSIQAYRFKLGGKSFDPHWIVDGTLRRHVGRVQEFHFKSTAFVLLTSGSLHAALLGPVPVGAYIPFPGSEVMLGDAPATFPDDPIVPLLVDHYSAAVGRSSLVQHRHGPKHTLAEVTQGYPLLQLLGPNLILWSDESGTRLPGTPLMRPAADDEVTALFVPGSTFATQLAVAPLSRLADRALLRRDHKIGHQARKMIFIDTSDRGTLSMTLDRPMAANAYAGMRRRLSRNDMTAIKTYEVGTFKSGGQTMPLGGATIESERYPPLPANRGFNVFGPMERIQFDRATGALVIGDRSVDLPAPSQVVLSGVKALANATNQQLIPLPLSTATARTKLEFQGVSAVTINGVDETWFVRRHEALLTSIGLVATVIGALVAILSFAWTVGVRPRET